MTLDLVYRAIRTLVELVGIEQSTRPKNRQVVDFGSIAKCPECLQILHPKFIVRLLYGEFGRLPYDI